MPTELRQFNARSQALNGSPEFRAIVISIHGANTTGLWQKQILTPLQRKAFLVVGADYGFARYKLLNPKRLLCAAVESIWDRYEHHYHDNLPFCALAHSFGTLALSELMESNQDACFDRVILAGSIVRRDFPWHDYLRHGRLKGVLNEVSINDRAVTFSPLLKTFAPTLGVGRSGTKGFATGSPGLSERFHKNGHSGVLSEVTCERTWTPFFLGVDSHI